MNSSIVKRAVIICAVMASLSPVFASQYKYSVTNIKLAKDGNCGVKVNVITSKPYSMNLNVVQRGENKYVILMPETENLTKISPVLDSINDLVQSVSVCTVPYSNNGAKGYTKIIINTYRPINVKAVTSIPVANSNDVNKQSKTVTVTNSGTKAKTQQKDNTKKEAQKVINKTSKVDNIQRKQEQSVKTGNTNKSTNNSINKEQAKPSQVNKNIKPKEDLLPPEPNILIQQKQQLEEEIKKEKQEKEKNNNKESENVITNTFKNIGLSRTLLILSAIGFPVLVLFWIIFMNKKMKRKIEEYSSNNQNYENANEINSQEQNNNYEETDDIADINTVDENISIDEEFTTDNNEITNNAEDYLEYHDNTSDTTYQTEFIDEIVTDNETIEPNVMNDESNIIPTEDIENEIITNTNIEDSLLTGEEVLEPEKEYNKEGMTFYETMEASKPMEYYESPINIGCINPTLKVESIEEQMSSEPTSIVSEDLQYTGMSENSTEGIVENQFNSEVIEKTTAGVSEEELDEESFEPDGFINLYDSNEFINFETEEDIVVDETSEYDESDKHEKDNLQIDTSEDDSVFDELEKGVDDSVFDNLIEDAQQENISNDTDIDDNVDLIYQTAIGDNKGFYLIDYDKTTALIGYINDNVFVIKVFDEKIIDTISYRLTEQISEQSSRYILKGKLYKMIVDVSDNEMKHVIDL